MAVVELIKVVNFNFEYALAKKRSLININLAINSGDFITIAGDSGSGKTTLLRQFKPELWPVGKREGQILFEGQSISELAKRQSAQSIGMVFQNPDDQLVMDNVIQELAFSLENIDVPADVIQQRIAELVSFLGLQEILYEDVHNLSGGQKQMVNLAAVLILRPKLLILDEPTAQLDPIATKEFISLLNRVHDELGIAIVMSEHILDDVLPLSNKLWILKQGELMADGPTTAVLKQLWTEPHLRNFIPDVPFLFLNQQIAAQLPVADLPLTVLTGRELMQQGHVKVQADAKSRISHDENGVVAKLSHLSFEYDKNGHYILDDLNLSVHQQDWLAIIGKNGTGKTTLLKAIMGFITLRRGSIRLLDKKLATWTKKTDQFYREVSYLSQTPSDYFSYDTVQEEYEERAKQLNAATPAEAAQNMMRDMTIDQIANRNPHDASGGEQQLIALGLLLMSNPKLLLLDEPTKGLDPIRRQKLGDILQKRQTDQNLTIIMVSHDMNFSAQFANRCALLFDGKLVAQAEPHQFFADNFFYTTTVNRLLRYQLPNVIERGEVIP